VDQETLITPIPTFPRQGGRRLRVRDPIAKRTSPEGEGFPASPKGTLRDYVTIYKDPHSKALPAGRESDRLFPFSEKLFFSYCAIVSEREEG
jgi:hypothetical protein